jgi:uncharacterized protein (TIGR02246 family)
MKRLLMTTACLVGLSGLAQAAELTQAEAQKIVQSVSEGFAQSWAAKQPEKMVALFAVDGWRITDNGPIVGKDALTKHWTEIMQVAKLDDTQVDHIKVVDSNTISATGHWVATLTLPDQPAPLHGTGFWYETLAKQQDGTWKLAVEAYNVKPPGFQPANAKNP